MTGYGIAAWIIFIVAWVVLMRYVLPKMGIPTCMSGMCGLPPDMYKQKPIPVEIDTPANGVRRNSDDVVK